MKQSLQNHIEVTRPSIVLLLMQLLVLELIMGVIGLIARTPFIWFMQQGFSDIGSYIAVHAVLQTINIIFILFITLRYANRLYRIEGGSFIVRDGIFNTSERTYTLDNVESMSVEQTWFSRIFGYGTLHLFSPLYQDDVYAWGIPDPYGFMQKMKEHIPTGTRIQVIPKV